MKLQFLFLSFLILACVEQKQNYPPSIKVTQDFLEGRWMLDSIIGKDDWKQDWLYFTDDDKFWQFSKYNESYLIEKELGWKKDKIIKNGKTKYLITPLDSQHIILHGTNEKFHCKRWGDFEREDIERFLKANPLKKKINGWWKLEVKKDSIHNIPSWCNNLGNETKFYFNPNGKLEIYPIDEKDNKYCKSYTYSIFVNDKPQLNLQELDMIISYNILELNDNRLILDGIYEPITNKTLQMTFTKILEK